MQKRQNPETTKQRIMDAAEQIVVSRGAGKLTFDELVLETGVSKGGILYHYPSKSILLASMVKRMLTGFGHGRRRAGDALGYDSDTLDSDGMAKAKTYILASFDHQERERNRSTALIAAAANDPELLGVVREHFKANFDEIRQMGNKSMLAMILFLAADGLWLLDALQLSPLTKDERLGLKEMMLKLADA